MRGFRFVGWFCLTLALLIAEEGMLVAGPLHQAVRSLDLNRFHEVLDTDPGQAMATDTFGVPALQYAAGLGSVEMVSRLLQVGADIHGVDTRGNTALHWLVNIDPLCGIMVQPKTMKLCNLDVLPLLASAGIRIDAQNASGETALHVAAHQGVYGMVKALCDLGASPNVVDGVGQTPLHHARGSHAPVVFGLLLSYGADPLHTDLLGFTPVDLASRAGNLDVLRVFERYRETRPRHGSDE